MLAPWTTHLREIGHKGQVDIAAREVDLPLTVHAKYVRQEPDGGAYRAHDDEVEDALLALEEEGAAHLPLGDDPADDGKVLHGGLLDKATSGGEGSKLWCDRF